MEPQVTLNVTFKNETQSFLVSDPGNTTWADVEAMVKVSFDLNTIQIKYLDEENEEVKYILMAVKQGNQLQMQVHEGYCVVEEAPPPIGTEKRPVARTGKKPLAHYSSLVRVLGSDMKTPEDPATQQLPPARRNPDQPQDRPPDWFTSYLETFREQVVKETVEKLEQKLHEKLVLQHPSLGSFSMPVSEETLFLPENQFSWHIACSSCQRSIVGVRYQCSLCSSYNICEDCESGPYAHDSNHVLLKLRRPVVGSSEPFSHSRFSTPRLPAALEQARLQKQVDKNFLKAEKQRLRAEKKQRKAEVKELKKQLKLHRKIHLWNSLHGLQNPKSPLGRPEIFPKKCECEVVEMAECLTDKLSFSCYYSFQLKFMWGNLTLASTEKKDVLVPCLKAGHVGVVSVEFIAPTLEGTYTSHWRLSHKGQQFGPRVWCSIIVDPFPSTESPDNSEKSMISSSRGDDLTCQQEEAFLGKEEILPGETTEQTEGTGTHIPQKAKSAANMTPCMSPLPHDSPLIEKPGLGQIQEESEGAGFKALPDSTVSVKKKAENFVCETVIRSLTLDAAPDHKPPWRQKSPQRAELQLYATEEQQPTVLPGFCSKKSSLKFALPEEGPLADEREEIVQIAEEEAVVEEEDELKDEVRSQSSASSEDYIIILPECFDTSRPLGDSMYSSALSQPSLERGAEGEPGIEAGQEPVEAGERPPGGDNQPQGHNINDILMTSQTLDTVPLTPEVVGPPPQLPRSPPSAQHHGSPGVDLPVTVPEVSSVPGQIREELRGSSGLVNSRPKSYDHSRHHHHHHHHGNSIAGGLVKGALSVAASAYKALFAGPPVTAQPVVSEDQTAALMAHLFEMGFCDRQLNLRLLNKHNYNILQVVIELLQVNNKGWYSHCY
uniref:Next to BRCA1 gene 1 protein n=1 Tax=Capra hircus TaxID=9925 RepID=A0A8C2PKV6_CAPHI